MGDSGVRGRQQMEPQEESGPERSLDLVTTGSWEQQPPLTVLTHSGEAVKGPCVLSGAAEVEPGGHSTKNELIQSNNCEAWENQQDQVLTKYE